MENNKRDTSNNVNEKSSTILKKNIPVSPELITKIRTELIEKTYYNDIKYSIHGKSRWKCVGDITETISHIFIAFGIILAFAAGFFNIEFLSFLSGSCTTAAMVFIKFSSYALKESKDRTEQVNLLIEQLGFNDIPNIVINSSGDDFINNNNSANNI